jgi:hypothetical protein
LSGSLILFESTGNGTNGFFLCRPVETLRASVCQADDVCFEFLPVALPDDFSYGGYGRSRPRKRKRQSDG